MLWPAARHIPEFGEGGSLLPGAPGSVPVEGAGQRVAAGEGWRCSRGLWEGTARSTVTRPCSHLNLAVVSGPWRQLSYPHLKPNPRSSQELRSLQ